MGPVMDGMLSWGRLAGWAGVGDGSIHGWDALMRQAGRLSWSGWWVQSWMGCSHEAGWQVELEWVMGPVMDGMLSWGRLAGWAGVGDGSIHGWDALMRQAGRLSWSGWWVQSWMGCSHEAGWQVELEWVMGPVMDGMLSWGRLAGWAGVGDGSIHGWDALMRQAGRLSWSGWWVQSWMGCSHEAGWQVQLGSSSHLQQPRLSLPFEWSPSIRRTVGWAPGFHLVAVHEAGCIESHYRSPSLWLFTVHQFGSIPIATWLAETIIRSMGFGMDACLKQVEQQSSSDLRSSSITQHRVESVPYATWWVESQDLRGFVLDAWSAVHP